MGFQAPFVLFGLAAVGIPVAIHLLNKMRIRRVRWGAMKFLREAVESNQRRIKVEDLLLLLARCLLVALLVLAFARPVLNPGAARQIVAGGAKVAVLVLDRSASMGASDGTRTRMETAKEAAVKYLDSLARESRVALIFADSQGIASGTSPSTDLATIRKTLDSAVPSGGAADWSPAIAQAFDLLKAYRGADREVVVFADTQANGWEKRADIVETIEANPDIPIRLTTMGGGSEPNLAVVAIRPALGAPVPGHPFQVIVEIANFGDSPAADVPVSLGIDKDAPTASAMVPQIGPGQRESVALNAVFPQAGHHTATASIPPDRLPADDSRSWAVRVNRETRVALVENPADGRAGFFLSNALLPMSPARAGEWFLKVDFASYDWLEEAPLERFNALFLMNPEHLSPSSVARLRSYVESGGSLIVFPGASTETARFNAEFHDFAPATLGDIQESPLRMWSAGPHSHPLVAFWNGQPESALDSIKTTKNFPLLASDPGARSVVDFSDGTPAIVEADRGEGRFILFSTPLDTKWTNLPLNPNFVPLVQRLLADVLSPRSGTGQIVKAGSVFQQKTSDRAVDRVLLVEAPGEAGKKPAGFVSKSERGGRIIFRDTLAPGAYRLFFDGSDQSVAAFTVDIPAEESNLASLGASPFVAAVSSSSTSGRLQSTGSGVRREWWSMLIGAALVLAVVESVMAHRFSIPR